MHLYEITHVFSQPPTINAVFHVSHMYTTMNMSNGNKVFYATYNAGGAEVAIG